MRVLVTGATGFIGSHLCEALCARGDEVTALVRTPAKAASLPPAVQQLHGDLSLFSRSEIELPVFDVVVHLAGVVTAADPEDYERINYTAVGELMRCLEAQSWQPRRVLFASSLAAAGPSHPGRAWTETDPLNPIDPYGGAKARAETVVRSSPLASTIFRPCIVLGPGDPATLTLYQAASRGVGLQVGRRAQELSWVDVRDVVSALVAMADDEREGDRTYYIAHPDLTDVRRLWKALGRALDRRVHIVRLPGAALWLARPFAAIGARLLGRTNQLDGKQIRQMTAPAFACSARALEQELDWAPRHDLQDALQHAIAGYRRAGRL